MIYIVIFVVFHVLRAPRRRWRFAGAERGSSVSQFALNPFCERMRAPEHAPRYGLIENLAGAIFANAHAPRKDLVEATEIVTKQLKRLRQVLGAAHPATQRHENHLKKLQERLAHLE